MQQRQDVRAILAAEQSVFVLNDADIHPALVDELSCLQIGIVVVLMDDKPDLGRIAVLASGLVDGHNKAFRCIMAGGQRIKQVFGKRTRSEEHTYELKSLMRISYSVF